MVQEIQFHRLVEDSPNSDILIHHYEISSNEIANYKNGDVYQIWTKSNNNWEKKVQVKFGKSTPNGMDGVTPETLIAVVLDRYMQQGLFPRIDDDEAKHRIIQALNVLKGGQSTKYVPPPPPEPEKKEEVVEVKKPAPRKRGKKL